MAVGGTGRRADSTPMSYQVIARKYRPQRFADVVGQEHVTQTLANAIKSGRVAHAYLFCGPRGTGKTTVARIFAKALNCTGGPKADFDDTDPRCREIAEGRSLDVLEIDGASNNGVEQVRELRDTARFAPASSKFKIYIIDEVHMLTTAAFNALLKTLEEPPPHVKFLFATTDPEKVLPTILSRCQRFDLRRIPMSLIVQHLGSIAKAEGVTIDDAALHAVARGADGGMRDAESTLDQLISFCGERVEEADVLSMFGLAARAQILALTRAILQADAPTALGELNALARNGKDLGRLLNDLLQHFRNLLVFQVAGGDPAAFDVSEADVAELRDQAGMAPTDAVTRVLEVLSLAEGRLRDAVARKIFLEVTLMRAIQARTATSLDAVLRQLQQLREGPEATTSSTVPSTLPAPPSPASPPTASPKPPRQSIVPPADARPTASSGSPTPSPAPSPAPPASVPPPSPGTIPPPAPGPGTATVPGGAATAADLPAFWAQVVAAASPLTRASLQVGQPLSFEKGVLVIGYAPSQENHRALVDTDRTRKGIEARLTDLGRPGTVKLVRSEAVTPTVTGEATTPPASAPSLGTGRPGGAGGGPTAGGGSGPAAASGTGAGTARAKAEKVSPMKLDPAEFKNDPLIREALELFRGQLVVVRRAGEPETGSN